MRPLDPRWKGTFAALLLFAFGAVAGVAGDRIWLGMAPVAAEAAPLTPEGMVRSLDLDPVQGARVRSVLDSLRGEVARAAAAGPDSLRDVAQRARQRLEDVLPPDRRPQFQRWMQQHHDRMMARMGGGMMGRGMMRGGGRGGGMMRGGPPGDSGAMRPGPGGRGRMMGGTGRGGMMGGSGRGGMMGGSGATGSDSGGGRMHR